MAPHHHSAPLALCRLDTCWMLRAAAFCARPLLNYACRPRLLPATGRQLIGSVRAAAAEGMSAIMIDDGDWEGIRKHMETYDEKREVLIKRCRDMQKLAKQSIYSLHRGEVAKAGEQLKSVETIAAELRPLLQTYPTLRQGSYSSAMEEYAEAVTFRVFLSEGRLVKLGEMPLCEVEEYLGGVLDFTGELNRYSVQRATQRDKAAVQACRDLTDAIMGQFLRFDLRNGALRKKYDALKYTLQKMENTLYELSLSDALKSKRMREDEGEGADGRAGGPSAIDVDE